MKMTKMLKRKEEEDEEGAGDAGGVLLRASGADADGIEKHSASKKYYRGLAIENRRRQR
jgi:hypothetical protein